MSLKDLLLSHLKKEKGRWISGESLSRGMSVTRSAIWKHVRRLRQEGYLIESSPKKGYLLQNIPDLISESEIRDGLNTKILGRKKIVCLREMDSTNARAKALAISGAPEGTVVIAESQTHGKGRKGRSWFSPCGGGVYLSVVLRPRIPPTEAPKITLLAAVAASEAIASLLPLHIAIKWPNDLVVGGKKIAGILTEISTEMDTIDYMIVGIGINVNIATAQFPPEIRSTAASILSETGKPYPRVKLIREYLASLERCYGSVGGEGFEPVMNKWRAQSNVIGRRIMIDVLGRKYYGEVEDIDPDGVLILRDGKGELRRFFSGDVTILRTRAGRRSF
ncbi:MAG: biotin--[acetyl-CoA-carboxylase] ligase [Syntrophales bacterium]